MTITTPISVEPQHDDIEVIDDLQIIEDVVSTTTAEPLSPATQSEPLIPFLIIGVLSWIGIVVTAVLLAF